MKRRLIAPILMISLGLNLLFGYQNCGQVDPSFVFNDLNDGKEVLKAEEDVVVEVKKQAQVAKPYLHISKVKVVQSDMTRLQRKVRYDFQMEFRTKYTTEYIGVDPVVTKPFVIKDAKNNIVAKIPLDAVDILENSCSEAIDTKQRTYFDCKYTIKVATDLDMSVASAVKQKYNVSNSAKGIEFEMLNRGRGVGKKHFTTAINYLDRYVPAVKPTTKKMQAKLPKVNKKVAKKKVKAKAKVAVVKPAKKKVSLKKKLIEKEPALVEGVYCHIRVLNPPHLELLSDVKKVGSYYEDADTCRDVAVRLSKTYCGHSLMGELDINWSLKDKREEGEKVISKDIESIECT